MCLRLLAKLFVEVSTGGEKEGLARGGRRGGGEGRRGAGEWMNASVRRGSKTFSLCSWFENGGSWASRMAQWVKAVATKLEDLI